MNYDIIYINDKMKRYTFCTENIDSLINSIGDEIFTSIINFIHPVGQTVIYDEDSLNETDVNWERVFKFTNNFTGYEVGCNEFTVPIEKIENIPIDLLALNFLDRLKKKFADIVFVVYFILHDENLEFRFHMFRDDEGYWLSDFKKINYPLICLKG